MRSRRQAALLAAAALLLTACAGVTTDGRVHAGHEVRQVTQDGYLRVLPEPPAKGDPPDRIVRGFLRAASSPENDFHGARAFLTSGTAGRWRPDAGVTVYDGQSLSALTQPSGAVLVVANEVGTIDAEGRYTLASPGSHARASFGLAKVHGEWRIDALPQGLFLTPNDVVRAYRSVDLYFLVPGAQVLVPDPVFVPARPDLATSLVEGLLRGPTSWSRPAVRTAFPPRTVLVGGDVPVVNGRATVQLSAEVVAASAEQRQAMAAQLAYSLHQVPDVATVRILVEGAPLTVPGAPNDFAVSTFPAFDPGALAPDDAQTYVLRAGRFGTLGVGGVFSPAPGAAGEGLRRLRRPAVTLQGDRMAGVATDGRTLLEGQIAPGVALISPYSGTSLGAPSFDVLRELWVADRTWPTTSEIVVLPSGQAPIHVETPGLRGVIVAMRVSRDGTRLALAVHNAQGVQLLLGRVVRTHDSAGRVSAVRVEGWQRLDSDLVTVNDLAWADADRVAVLGANASSPQQVFLVDVDGWRIAELGSVTARTVTAAPGRPVLVESAAKVFQALGRQWTVIGPGTDPVYPG